MAIVKKEVSSVPSDVATLIKQSVIQPSTSGLTKDQSIARSVAMNNTFGAGWFKDTCQVMSLEDATKKAFEVAAQIEAWLTR